MTAPMSEHLLNDYADEIEEKGKLTAGKASNLLNEALRARREAAEQRAAKSRARNDAENTRRVLKRLLDAFPVTASEEEAEAVEAARAHLAKVEKARTSGRRATENPC